MNYVLSLFLPLVVFASGLLTDTQTYNAPISPKLEQKLTIPIIETKPSQIAISSPTSEVKTENIYCSCVNTLRQEIPDLPLLNAIDWPLNTITPKIGDIIKLQYYNATTTRFVFHIALIKEITEEGYKIYQGNKPTCATSSEIIEKDDERILGFFNPSRQRLIDALTPIQKETLWNESGWSMYDTKGAVIRGKDGEWGLAQIMPNTLDWLTEKRREENIKPVLLDKMSFEDQIVLFKYGWDKGVVWYGRPTD